MSITRLLRLMKRREQKVGPLHYQISLNPRLAEVAGDLLRTRLLWVWGSSREADGGTYSNPDLPDEREWTVLSADTSTALTMDLIEEGPDDTRRSIDLYGWRGGSSESSVRDKRFVLEQLKRFANCEENQLQIFLFCFPDGLDMDIFVPQPTSQTVQELIRLWASTPGALRGRETLKPTRLRPRIEWMVDGLSKILE